ncbi:MAG: transposase, partial [Phycisphaerae bacterium]
PEHVRQLEEQGIEPIDMIVVNLYPFEKTVADPDCTFEQAIEMIDIGGPCLLRAAAKNHHSVVVLSSPDQYQPCLTLLQEQGAIDARRRMDFASTVYGATSAYDDAITGFFHDLVTSDDREPASRHREPDQTLPTVADWDASLESNLRYGENPHQQGGIYDAVLGDCDNGIKSGGLIRSQVLGPEMSFNNYVDASAALELCKELSRELAVKPAKEHWGKHVGPASQPVSRRVSAQRHTERHLPHIEDPGAHYFLTFRLRVGTLTPAERRIVLESCKYWHRKKMTLHACVIMPDHVHMIVTPHEVAPGEWVALGEILHSIKSYSAQEVNKRRRSRGALWLDETWDRIIRNEREYEQRWEYIEHNPERIGLGRDYEWLWVNHRAWDDLAEFDRLGSRSHTPRQQDFTVVFVKHTNACGVGVAQELVEAYRRAYLGDPNAAMGGVLACNFDVTSEFAAAVMETYARWGKEAGAGGFFVEVWVAPSFDDEAVRVIQAKKKWGERVRLLAVQNMPSPPNENELDYKRITGGMVVQTRDTVGLNEDEWKVVTKRSPGESEMADICLAWLICKHTKSNAITICKDGMLIGNGAGQASRVMSCRIATWLAKEN